MTNTIRQLKRIGIGLLAMTAVAIVLDFIPSFFQFVPFAPTEDPFFMSQPLPTMEQSLKIGIAACVGAYFARVPFVIAAAFYHVGMSLWSFYVITLIAEAVQPVSIFEVTARNSIGTGIGLIAAVVGAILGFREIKARLHNSQG